MTVLRINRREKNFLIVDKACLNEANLSWGAKGLHAYLMGLPNDWKVYVEDLRDRSSNGRDSTRAYLKELKEKGYISTERVRDQETGKYSRFEYVIHETPSNIFLDEIKKVPAGEHFEPETEKPFVVNSPETGNPAEDIPTEGNAPLINNKYNKQQEKQAAASKEVSEEFGDANPASSAAAFSSPKKQTTKPTSTPTPIATPTTNNTESRIGDALTPDQEQRTWQMINRLSVDETFKDSLRDEVVHCLLSDDCFKACGRDFAHKLNAIRVVIQRGEWRRPSSMVVEAEVKQSKKLDELNKGLRAAHADATHFKRLCHSATGRAKATFEKCMKEAQVRITEMENKLEAFMSRQAVEAC